MKLELESRKRKLLGLSIYDLSMDELIQILDFRIKGKITTIVHGVSALLYPRLKELPGFVHYLNQVDIVITDGAGTVPLAKTFGVPLREQIGIPNLAYRLLELANQKSYKILLFGAKQDINESANESIKRKYPNIELCKGINGYFKRDDEKEIVRNINAQKPDIIFIGITSPIKELFALEYKSQLETAILLPCGGMIDVLAGKAKRPPINIKGVPTTWFFRFLQEPRRLYDTTLKLVFRFLFLLFPALYFKHLFGIERNPSIVKHYNLDPDIRLIGLK